MAELRPKVSVNKRRSKGYISSRVAIRYSPYGVYGSPINIFDTRYIMDVTVDVPAPIIRLYTK